MSGRSRKRRKQPRARSAKLRSTRATLPVKNPWPWPISKKWRPQAARDPSARRSAVSRKSRFFATLRMTTFSYRADVSWLDTVRWADQVPVNRNETRDQAGKPYQRELHARDPAQVLSSPDAHGRNHCEQAQQERQPNRPIQGCEPLEPLGRRWQHIVARLHEIPGDTT